MGKFWELYESMQEIVYVTDMDTYQIVYVNRYGREKLKLQSVEEIYGKPCYEVLQRSSSPCSICTNDRLKPGQFYEWKYHNGMLDTTFLLKDVMVEEDGKRYRLEIAIDVGEMDAHKKAIKEFTSNEAMVNDALRLALAEPTPEKSIQVLLKHLGQSLRSDRVYIFEQKSDAFVDNTYEWCAGGVEPQKEFLQGVPFDVVSLWYEAFERNENIIIKGLESIRYTDPKVYATLLPQQVDTLVVSPLVMDDKIIGFYGVDNPPKDFLNHISVMFMVLGYFISSILKRRNLVEKLEKLSYYDQLTGALNRHGMNEFVANVDREASIGIVYCDLMGLKQVNDQYGHLQGDALLVRAYECICSAFPRETVFRVGGDEFLVMSSHITKDDMARRVQLLRSNMPEYDLDLAVGDVWMEACGDKIMELLRLADERMYEDKATYYAKRADERRAT